MKQIYSMYIYIYFFNVIFNDVNVLAYTHICIYNTREYDILLPIALACDHCLGLKKRCPANTKRASSNPWSEMFQSRGRTTGKKSCLVDMSTWKSHIPGWIRKVDPPWGSRVYTVGVVQSRIGGSTFWDPHGGLGLRRSPRMGSLQRMVRFGRKIFSFL